MRIHPGRVVSSAIPLAGTAAAEESARLGPGSSRTFTVHVAALPSGTDALTFAAVQTYSDGQVESWGPGGTSSAAPAPVLQLLPAPGTPAPVTAPVATPAAA